MKLTKSADLACWTQRAKMRFGAGSATLLLIGVAGTSLLRAARAGRRALPSAPAVILLPAALALWLGLSGQAFAARDQFHPDGATWTVNTALPGAGEVSNNTAGPNLHTTLNPTVYSGDAIVVTATWSVSQGTGGGGGATTSYSRTLTFTPSTSDKPSGASNVSVVAISNCVVASATSTCTTTINFSAPATTGSYQVKIDSGGGGASNDSSRLETTGSLFINFTVAENLPEPIETMLMVYQQCYLLNQGPVDLTAKLEELVSGDPIDGAEIDFYINPPSDPIGSEWTDSGGVATLVHDITGLPVGDHNLYAEFAGDIYYNGSNDSDTLGITYLFTGFGQPINGDGTSIFGGRVIPIKIRLYDANGVSVPDAAPTVWLQTVDMYGNLGTEVETTSVSAADTGNIMRYDPYEQQYIYNWDAKDLANGTYRVVVHLGDSSTCRSENPYAIITVQKKNNKK